MRIAENRLKYEMEDVRNQASSSERGDVELTSGGSGINVEQIEKKYKNFNDEN